MRSFTIIAIILLTACENKIANQKGEQGIQGVAGAKGDKSDPGPQGDKGFKGDHGATGLQGVQGLQGVTGSKGDQGIVGSNGPQGSKGDKGDPGSIGLPGSDGTSCVGESVPEGVLVICGNQKFLVKHGDVGPAGAKGEKDEVGSQGPKGDQGSQGIQGVAGKDGAPGLDGLPGAKGEKGDQGSIGLTGSQGLKGDKGDVGAQGPAGKDSSAECPPNSTPVILDGVLVYCYAIQPQKPGVYGAVNYTGIQCLKTCATQKMQIASIQGLALGCLANKDMFVGADDQWGYHVSWHSGLFVALYPHFNNPAAGTTPKIEFCETANNIFFLDFTALQQGTILGFIGSGGETFPGYEGGSIFSYYGDGILSPSLTHGCICGHQPF